MRRNRNNFVSSQPKATNKIKTEKDYDTFYNRNDNYG